MRACRPADEQAYSDGGAEGGGQASGKLALWYGGPGRVGRRADVRANGPTDVLADGSEQGWSGRVSERVDV